MAFSKILCLIALILTWDCGAQNLENIDSLKRLLVRTESDSIKIYLNDAISEEWILSNYDSSLIYAQEGHRIAVELGDKQGIALTLNSIGLVYDYKGNIEKAKQYYLEGLRIRKEIGDQSLVANSLNNLGVAAYYAGNYEEALYYYLQALKIRESIGDSIAMAQSFNNLGIIYRLQNDPEKARDSYTKSLELRERLDDQQGILYALMNLGVINYNEREYPLAESQTRRAIAMAKALYEPMSQAQCHSTLGDILSATSRYVEASAEYAEALKIFEELNDQRNLANLNIRSAELQNKLGNHKMALSLAKKALTGAQNIEQIDVQKDALKVLAETSSLLGNFQLAYQAFNQHVALKDTLLNAENNRAMAELNTKYETEKKEQEIALLNAQNELNLLTIKQSNEEKFFITILATVVALALILVYVNYRKKQRVNQELETALSEKEVLLREIHHRVKNNLQVISSLLNLQSKYVEDQSAIDAVKEGQNRVKSMALIHQKLYQENNLTGITIADYIQNLADSLYSSYGVDREKVGLSLDVENLNLDVDTTIPLGLIVNELISNTLKYAFPNDRSGVLSISLKQYDQILQLAVKDDGAGLPKGLDWKKSPSFGLKLVNALADKLKATVDIQNDQGTTVQMNISQFKLV